MAEVTSPEPLAPDLAARLTEFARACKGAVRSVSLYPERHPVIRASLERLVDASERTTGDGSVTLTILSNSLLVNGCTPERPDQVIADLAAVLHGQLIGSLVLHGGASFDSWQSLLRLLVRPPEEVRAEGGIKQAWVAAGGEGLDIEEVDYAEILRERQAGVTASLEEIVSSCLRSLATGEPDDATVQGLLGVVDDPAKLEELAELLKERTAGQGAAGQSAAVLQLLRGLAGHLERTQPDQIDSTLEKMGALVGTLSAEAMADLLAKRDTPEAVAGSVNVVDATVDRMKDGDVARFVAESVVAQQGATERLAEAFQSLVPDPDRREQVLSLAEQEVAESAVGQDEECSKLWDGVEHMLTSYSDAPFVSQDYARELSAARRQAVEVDEVSDDPPERVSAWLATVDDAELYKLDHQLLLDVLSLESDGYRWRDIANVVAGQIEDVVRAGELEVAQRLLEAIARETDEDGRPDIKPLAEAALERLATGKMIRAALKQLDASDDEGYGVLLQLCNRLGPAVISALAETLATEQDARGRRRLGEVLLGFGARGREAVELLLHSDKWEVRRTAAYLLRELGGADAFASLEPLLTDPEPRVRREAIRTLLILDDERARETLVNMVSSSATSREALTEELFSMRDERAAPLCAHLVRHVNHRAFAGVYLAAIDGLATLGGADAVAVLKEALYRGEWWAPFRTRALRSAAAGALRKTGDPAALDLLREASTSGPRGVRAAARAQRAHLERSS